MVARITRMTKRRLGELLRAEGLINEEQMNNARAAQRKDNMFLNEALVNLGYVTEEAIAAVIAQQFSLPFLGAEQYEVSDDILDIFPPSMLHEYQFMPMEKIGNVLIIIGAGLMNHDVLSELERMSHCRICQYVGRWTEIRETIESKYKDYKPSDGEEMSDLGAMLLGDDLGGDDASDEDVNAAAEAAMAAISDEDVSGTSNVVAEALAAVEKKPAAASTSKAPAAASTSKAPAAGSTSKAPAADVEKRLPVNFSTSQRLSAFAKPAKKGEEPAGDESGGGEAQEDGEQKPAAKAAKKDAPQNPKGGLLGFLKK